MATRGTHFVRTLLLIAGVSLVAMGQNVTGTIESAVKDASGVVVPNVTVTVTNVGTNAAYNDMADGQGNYSIRLLPVGIYNLSASVPGFKKYDANGIRVQVNETSRVGGTSESVNVESVAVHVGTESPVLKSVIDQTRDPRIMQLALRFVW